MEDGIGKVPATELVDLWLVKSLNATHSEGEMLEIGSIAQEIDRRCGDLRIEDGCLVVTGRGTVEKWRTWEGYKVKLPAAELHALLGWLLMKGGPRK